jgi:phosphatidylserine/phosphatidylglycerophosphate/cardiolipin synthase-like enzyme
MIALLERTRLASAREIAVSRALVQAGRATMSGWEVFHDRVMGALLLAVAVGYAFVALRAYWRREPAITAHFSPKGGCTATIVSEVSAARSEVLVMAYSFSCPDIANALIAASQRGVKVVVLLDRTNEKETYSELGDLGRHGVEVWIDACHAIAHNKVIVIDRRTVITGSFNFTRQAEHENAENLLVLRNHHDLAARYRTNFHTHKDHCHAPGTPSPPHVHSHAGHTPPTPHLHDHAR